MCKVKTYLIAKPPSLNPPLWTPDSTVFPAKCEPYLGEEWAWVSSLVRAAASRAPRATPLLPAIMIMIMINIIIIIIIISSSSSSRSSSSSTTTTIVTLIKLMNSIVIIIIIIVINTIIIIIIIIVIIITIIIIIVSIISIIISIIIRLALGRVPSAGWRCRRAPGDPKEGRL